MSEQTNATNNYHRRVERVLLVILLLNLVVVAGKGIVGWMAGSLSVISDAIHSSIDAVNNIIGIIVIRFAAAPPDREHPYGHGKFETLGAFCVAGFLSITCFEIASRAVGQILAHEAITPQISWLTVAVMVITIAINIFVANYEAKCGRELHSELLVADATHTRSDIYISISVLLSLFCSWLGYGRVDSLFALAIAGIIAYNGYQLFRETVPILVDAATLDSRRIEQIARSVPGVIACNNIRSRGRPGDLFIEMVIVLSAESFHHAHHLTEQIERLLKEEFGRVAITIHFEPGSARDSKPDHSHNSGLEQRAG